MPEPQGGSPGVSTSPPPGALPLAQEEARLRDAQFAASVPPTFRVLGGIYAVLSGTVFFYAEGSLQVPAAILWAVTAGLGLLTIGAGSWLRKHDLPAPWLTALATLVGVLYVAHACAFAWVFDDPGQGAYLLTLLAAGGYFLLSWRATAVFITSGVAGWILASQGMGLAWSDPAGGYVLAGAFVGVVAHMTRRRHVRAMAMGRSEVLGTLHASEERFRSLAETAKDTILLLDEAGRITYLNPAGLQMFGLRSSEAMGRFLSQVVSDAGTDLEHLVGTVELNGLRRDGTTFPAELSLTRTTREGVVGFTGILRDITERKRAAAESQAASEREAEVGQLRTMNEFKTRFLNMAAHELNTPLTPLRLQLHLLKAGQMGELNERQAKAITLLDRNVTRLSGLVGEILDVARLQGGRLKLTPQPVAVDEVVDEVLESFSETARRVGVALSFAGAQNLVVQADRNRVTQVLFNLVSNALKFTPAGGRAIVEASDQGDRIVISVADTGLGLTPEQIARLFQPFSQVHDPMAVTAAGTGLGLYICKGLVEAQGGTIQCLSAGPGHGTTFRFSLPSSSAEPGLPPAPQGVTVPSTEDPLARRLRELI